MKYTEPGTYKIQYTAEDGCGKTTVADRTVIVEAPPRTVLYSDGTFIINELGKDRASNEALHGAATNEYIPFDPNGATDAEKYIFSTTSKVLWRSVLDNIKKVMLGETIKPYSMGYWFYNATEITSIETEKIDTSETVSMNYAFTSCQSLTALDVSKFDTSKVSNMNFMFNNCSKLQELDLSRFNTSSVTTFVGMFQGCRELEKIYTSDLFTVVNATNANGMFADMSTNLVGGMGTVWSDSHINGDYAHIDGGTSNPGYFTAKE